jgi:hypothetical protein
MTGQSKNKASVNLHYFNEPHAVGEQDREVVQRLLPMHDRPASTLGDSLVAKACSAFLTNLRDPITIGTHVEWR